MKKHLIISIDDNIIFEQNVDNVVLKVKRKPELKDKKAVSNKNPKLTLKADWKEK